MPPPQHPHATPPQLPSLIQRADPSKSRLNYLLQPSGTEMHESHLHSSSLTASTRLEALSLAERASTDPPSSTGYTTTSQRTTATRLPSLAAAYPLPPLPPTQTRARSADSAVLPTAAHAALYHHQSAAVGGVSAGKSGYGFTSGAGSGPGSAFAGGTASHASPVTKGEHHGHQMERHHAQHELSHDSMIGVTHHSLSEPPLAPSSYFGGNGASGAFGTTTARRPPTADSGFSDVTIAAGGLSMSHLGAMGGSGSMSSGPSLSMSSVGTGMAALQARAAAGLRRPHFSASGGSSSGVGGGGGGRGGGKSEAELRDKREMRRMKNRISAARSRQRKTDTFETLQRELVEAKTVIEALTRELDRANGGREQSGGIGAVGDSLGPPPPPTVIAVPQDLRPVVGRDFVSADGLMDLLRGYIRQSGR